MLKIKLLYGLCSF